MKLWRSRVATVALIALAVAVTGCSTIQNARGGPGQRLDPWEQWNRKVFAFNEGLDESIIKPVATGYVNVVPQLLRRGVNNVFSNVADAWSAFNNLLQAKFEPAFEDAVRVTTNSVLGFGGMLDVASEFGLDHHYEDFGQTLGTWGFGAGAYVVWPLFGPSSVRDSIALPVDRWFVSPAQVPSGGRLQGGVTLLQIINTRANLLGASRVIDDIALDKYTFLRDAYLQRRRSLIFEGDDAEAILDVGNSAQTAGSVMTVQPAEAAASPSK